MDDARDVREFQRTGDPAHFRALVERHRDRVFRLILSLLGPGREGEAEELAQDVFVKAFRKLGQFRGDSRFGSWLFRIAYNQALDHRSRLGFRAVHQSAEVLETAPSRRREANPFEMALDARRRAIVRECVGRLPRVYRSVVHLHYWMGMTVPEIGRTLSTPEGTVKSYLYRARARLHEMLEERGVAHV